jgi:hypothetical protein
MVSGRQPINSPWIHHGIIFSIRHWAAATLRFFIDRRFSTALGSPLLAHEPAALEVDALPVLPAARAQQA